MKSEKVVKFAANLLALTSEGASVVGDTIRTQDGVLSLRAIRGQEHLLIMRGEKCIGSATPEELASREVVS